MATMANVNAQSKEHSCSNSEYVVESHCYEYKLHWSIDQSAVQFAVNSIALKCVERMSQWSGLQKIDSRGQLILVVCIHTPARKKKIGIYFGN